MLNIYVGLGHRALGNSQNTRSMCRVPALCSLTITYTAGIELVLIHCLMEHQLWFLLIQNNSPHVLLGNICLKYRISVIYWNVLVNLSPICTPTHDPRISVKACATFSSIVEQICFPSSAFSEIFRHYVLYGYVKILSREEKHSSTGTVSCVGIQYAPLCCWCLYSQNKTLTQLENLLIQKLKLDYYNTLTFMVTKLLFYRISKYFKLFWS